MIPKEVLIKTLALRLKEAELFIPEAIQSKLIDYLELLSKWNTIHNLTAIHDPVEMINHHLLDSLVLLLFLPPGKIIDVGTGAGLPGIPLALCKPEEKIVLIDSKQKKVAFVQHVISSLRLANAVAMGARVESYRPEKMQFELVISRAFGSLSEFIDCSKHLLATKGRFVAMKGALDATELAALPSGFSIEKIVPIRIPGVIALRHLIFIAATQEGK